MNNVDDKIIEPITADVKAQRIAHIYAEALYDAAEAQGQAQEVFDELAALVGDVFQQHPELETYFSSSAVSREHKTDAIDHAFKGRASETLTNFLQVLNHHDRLEVLRPVQLAYKELYQERKGLIPVAVTSATALTEQQMERLRRDLKESFGREPIVTAKVDPALIGGLMVKVGDWLYDATVRTQLDNLRKQLIERSSHAIQGGRDRFTTDA